MQRTPFLKIRGGMSPQREFNPTIGLLTYRLDGGGEGGMGCTVKYRWFMYNKNCVKLIEMIFENKL